MSESDWATLLTVLVYRSMLRKMSLQMNRWVHLLSVKEHPKSNDENIKQLIRSVYIRPYCQEKCPLVHLSLRVSSTRSSTNDNTATGGRLAKRLPKTTSDIVSPLKSSIPVSIDLSVQLQYISQVLSRFQISRKTNKSEEKHQKWNKKLCGYVPNEHLAGGDDGLVSLARARFKRVLRQPSGSPP